MISTQREIHTSIHPVDYVHRLGPFKWGRKIGPAVVIPEGPSEYSIVLKKTGIDFNIHGSYGEWTYPGELLALIYRDNPDTVIIGHTVGYFTYDRVREVTGVDINKDPQLKNRFFFQE